MEQRVGLTPDARQAMAAGVELCRRANLAIFTPEHLLGGALAVLAGTGRPGLPSLEAIEPALAMVHGSSDEAPPDEVSFAPGTRVVLESLAAAIVRVGRDSMGAHDLALGVIASGEVVPMFFSAMGVTRDELLAAIQGGGSA